MIVGVGIDVVNMERFAATLQRTPRLLSRLFTEAEQVLPPESLAARFAAKEALAKALATQGNLQWHDAEIPREPGKAPRIIMSGSVAARAAELNVDRLHVSLSHDAPVATAIVIAESAEKYSGFSNVP